MEVFISVANLHQSDANPDQDPSFHFDADPDPTLLFDADPIQLSTLIRILLHHGKHLSDANLRPVVWRPFTAPF